ncbi:MAG: aldehyde ferredoxin oxidoreductase, partial [Nitrososphaerales archaeon]|nr:aldehyde ferredoxin oxidoreductase [Nitrososphaerales archaeon]
MGNGYVGKIARIDLSKSIIREERIPDSILRMYIGGSGLGAKILYDETGAGTDPFSPENRLIFMTGPLTGTKVPLSGRHQVVSKSPLTGIYGEADVGGFWGAELKKAGYDGLIIQGKAEKPTYIWICDGSITLRNAEHLWGMDTYDLDEVLKKETDGKAVVASIGPAGERLARIAAIMHDGKDARAAGRCGLGAVMGSKNLKAIVV